MQFSMESLETDSSISVQSHKNAILSLEMLDLSRGGIVLISV